jgi:class 3 adenylate cyclase/HAMP domain-containing protein
MLTGRFISHEEKMKLRTFLIFFVGAFVVLTIMNDYITYGLTQLNEESKNTTEEMHATSNVAEDLLVANQYTTRFARAYVATGDQSRRDFYHFIFDLIDGKIVYPTDYSDDYWDRVSGGLTNPPDPSKGKGKSIEEIFLALNITNAEFNKLKEAKTQFVDLSKTEIKAMDLAAEYYAEQQKSPKNRNNKIELRPAVNLVYNANYTQANAEIAQQLAEFKNLIKKRFADKLSGLNDRYHQLMLLNAVLSAGLYLLAICSSLYLYFRIQKRGIAAIQTLRTISTGDLTARSSVTGSDEIGDLAALVNWTGNNLQEKVAELEDKVLNAQTLMTELKKERDRSEKLLHNILPAAIAERLSNGEDTIAEVHPEVTVLFSDIVGFTELSEKIGPSETVNMLNLLFGKFDELAEKHHVEKIKTIGDCYMVVAGVPNRDPLHCQHIAAFAIDARNCIEAFSRESPYKVHLRMGIHTGTVAAGVVGKHRFSYDLWGDVVNVASRFETSAEPDKIHVSEAVKFRLADDFLFLEGGEVKLKGKGIMKSFYLLGKKENMPEILEFKKP